MLPNRPFAALALVVMSLLVRPAQAWSVQVDPATGGAGTTQASADSTEVSPSSPGWEDEISVQGTLIGLATRMHAAGAAPGLSGSEIQMQTLQLAIESSGPERVATGSVVLDGSGFTGTTQETAVSEAHIRIFDAWAVWLGMDFGPLPFGAFVNHLLFQPMSQDVYGASGASATVGWHIPDGSHVSVTVVDSRPMGPQWLGAGVFDLAAADSTLTVGEYDGGTSWILSTGRDFMGGRLSVGATALLESGPGERGRFGNVFASASGLLHSALEIDVEAFKADRRAPILPGGRGFDESVISTTLSVSVPTAPGTVSSGSTFAGRRTHRLSHPIEFALRFETYLDDGLASELSTWTTRHRVTVGGRYALDPDDAFPGFVAVEAQRETFRYASGSLTTLAAGLGLVF